VTDPRSTTRYTARIAALLIAHDGHANRHDLTQALERLGASGKLPPRPGHTGSGGSKAAVHLRRGMRHLQDLDLVEPHGDEWHAPSLTDLADWLADYIADRTQAGTYPPQYPQGDAA
jgi:hypothetical protein